MLVAITKTTERNLGRYKVREEAVPYGTIALNERFEES